MSAVSEDPLCSDVHFRVGLFQVLHEETREHEESLLFLLVGRIRDALNRHLVVVLVAVLVAVLVLVAVVVAVAVAVAVVVVFVIVFVFVVVIANEVDCRTCSCMESYRIVLYRNILY